MGIGKNRLGLGVEGWRRPQPSGKETRSHFTGKGCKDKQQIGKKNQQWLFLEPREELWAYPIISTWTKCLYITSSLKINLGKRGQGILRWEFTQTQFSTSKPNIFFLQPLELAYVTKILNFHRKKHKDVIKSKLSM